MIEAGERHAAVVVADRDDERPERGQRDRLGDDEVRVADRHAVSALRDHREGDTAHVRKAQEQPDQPARILREEVRRGVVDPAVLDDDRPARPERALDEPLPGEQPGQRHDERRHADDRDERSLERPDRDADEEREHDRPDAAEKMAAVGLLQLGAHDADEAAEVRDREVDLAEQQDEHDAEGEHRRARHLHDDVVEVDRGEEVLRGEREEDDDDRQADGDRQAAEVAALEVLPDPGPEALVGLGDVEGGCGSGFGFGRHGVASSIAMPETFVGVPAVIACTTSCCVVARRS